MAVKGPGRRVSLSPFCSVDGGELFDRIIDENCNLTELDTILFVKQICEGIRHMHQMYILHLDLKVEQPACVSPPWGPVSQQHLGTSSGQGQRP